MGCRVSCVFVCLCVYVRVSTLTVWVPLLHRVAWGVVSVIATARFVRATQRAKRIAALLAAQEDIEDLKASQRRQEIIKVRVCVCVCVRVCLCECNSHTSTLSLAKARGGAEGEEEGSRLL